MLLRPIGRRPNLRTVGQTQNHNFLGETSKLTEKGRNDDATLAVQLHLTGVGKEGLHAVRVLHREATELILDGIPHGLGVHGNIVVGTHGEIEGLPQLLTEAGRNKQSALGVYVMLIGSSHGLSHLLCG